MSTAGVRAVRAHRCPSETRSGRARTHTRRDRRTPHRRSYPYSTVQTAHSGVLAAVQADYEHPRTTEASPSDPESSAERPRPIMNGSRSRRRSTSAPRRADRGSRSSTGICPRTRRDDGTGCGPEALSGVARRRTRCVRPARRGHSRRSRLPVEESGSGTCRPRRRRAGPPGDVRPVEAHPFARGVQTGGR